ncbi:hypothetical protein [Sphingomonas sp.]|uniref:hypothetical protein n=1 Tax=Sphingomonas sp. TaxID=28214 RepID=UPI0035C8494B
MAVHICKQNYIESRKAIATLIKVCGSYEEAQATLVGALASGELRAIGLEVTAPRNTIIEIARKPHEELQLIPIQFWILATQIDINQWRWESGFFKCNNQSLVTYNASTEYNSVKFHKRDIGDIVNPSSEPVRSGRPMASLWPEWVAELTAAVYAGDIKEHMRSAEVHRVLAERLAARSVEEPSKSTINPTLTAVLKRLRANED